MTQHVHILEAVPAWGLPTCNCSLPSPCLRGGPGAPPASPALAAASQGHVSALGAGRQVCGPGGASDLCHLPVQHPRAPCGPASWDTHSLGLQKGQRRCLGPRGGRRTSQAVRSGLRGLQRLDLDFPRRNGSGWRVRNSSRVPLRRVDRGRGGALGAVTGPELDRHRGTRGQEGAALGSYRRGDEARLSGVSPTGAALHSLSPAVPSRCRAVGWKSPQPSARPQKQRI